MVCLVPQASTSRDDKEQGVSDPWSYDDAQAEAKGKLPLAHSAPEFGETDPEAIAALPAESLPAKKPWQFSLGRLQLLIVILCVCSACLGAMLHVNEDEFTMVALLLLILPSGILILLGIGRGGYEVYKAWRADQALWHQQPWQSHQTPAGSDETHKK
jgi:hypothetical protein